MNGTRVNGPDDNTTSQSRLSSLTPEQLVQINLCCDQYERLWRENGFTSLADFLPSVLTDRRIEEFNQELVKELILVDIELRQRHGLLVTADDYLHACPSLNRVWLDVQLVQPVADVFKTASGKLTSGQRVGDYVILGPLGAGGMGTVYRAEHVLMKRLVALKLIQHQHQANVLLQRRFEREVHTLAKLSHPNVVTAFDARQDSGWLYLVTELIEGIDLGRLVREKGPLSPLKAAHYAWQAANGLHFAHGQGIVHRDVKPENLLLDQNQRIKVLDLGLARFSAPELEQADNAGLTESSQVLGTALYISPEQARSASTADARSDIYSLGCTLFFLLTGRPPYIGDSLVGTIVAHVSEPVPSVAQFSNRQQIPPQLDALVQAMMAKDPNDRPASMNIVGSKLAAIIKQLQGTAQCTAQHTAQGTAQPTTELVETDRGAIGLRLKHLLSFRSELGRRKLLLASMIAIPAFVAGVYLAFNFLFSETENQGPNLSTLAGLRFNGIDNYVEVNDFDEPITGHVAIEAIVRPNFSTSISSIVSWTGQQSFVLFRSVSNEWGAAYFDGITTPRLILASHSSLPGTVQMVAAMWDGSKLSLYVDGEPIEDYKTEYEMIPAPQKLLIGGIPEGIIPSHQGTRFLDGEVAVVRVSRSTQPLQLATEPSELTIQSDTLALFDFRKPTHLHTMDQTKRWRAHLRGIYSALQ